MTHCIAPRRSSQGCPLLQRRSCNLDTTRTQPGHSPNRVWSFPESCYYICRCCSTIWKCPLPASVDEVSPSQQYASMDITTHNARGRRSFRPLSHYSRLSSTAEVDVLARVRSNTPSQGTLSWLPLVVGLLAAAPFVLLLIAALALNNRAISNSAWSAVQIVIKVVCFLALAPRSSLLPPCVLPPSLRTPVL